MVYVIDVLVAATWCGSHMTVVVVLHMQPHCHAHVSLSVCKALADMAGQLNPVLRTNPGGMLLQRLKSQLIWGCD